MHLRLLSLALAAAALPCMAEMRYAGGDISMLPTYEEAGAKYRTHEGKPIADVLSFFHDEGMNAMRVRVFVNPDNYTGSDKDPNACQTIESVLPLCKRIKQDGFALMIDFHYSDTWADPAKQWTPKDWSDLNDEELVKKIYDYTRESLVTLKDAGIVPDFIQTGNEISYGMLWGPYGSSTSSLKKVNWDNKDDWKRFTDLLKSAGKACREVCPEAEIVLHTERVTNTSKLCTFYDKMKEYDVDYDIIGLSYYPYFHGPLSKLEYALNICENYYADKKIQIVETGYPYKWEVPGTNQPVDYPYSDEGQNQFAKALVDLLLKHKNVDGLYWWWMEYNAYGTSLSGWYNAPLFDSNTGKACSAIKTIASFADNNNAVEGIEADGNGGKSPEWYNIQGQKTDTPSEPGVYIDAASGSKIIVR